MRIGATAFWGFFPTFILSLLVGQPARASSCEQLLLLKPNLVESLHNAAKDDYDVRILTAEVGGKQRLVVMMGEAHIKSVRSAEVGREVLEHFDYVGREGYDPTVTWGGRFDKNVLHPVLAKLGLKAKPQFWFARLLGRLFGARGRTEGSTTTEASIAAIRREYLEHLENKSQEQLAVILGALEKLPANELDAAVDIDGVKVFTKREILELALSVRDGKKPEIELKGPKGTIPLEANHKPDFWENVSSLESYVTLGSLVGYYASAAYLPADAASAVTTGLLALAGYRITGAIASVKAEPRPWLQRLFPMSYGILRARNRTMVGNIHKSLVERPEIDQMLVVVGKAHLDEMQALLEGQGYTSIPLPTPAQMEAQDRLDAQVQP